MSKVIIQRIATPSNEPDVEAKAKVLILEDSGDGYEYRGPIPRLLNDAMESWQDSVFNLQDAGVKRINPNLSGKSLPKVQREWAVCRLEERKHWTILKTLREFARNLHATRLSAEYPDF